MDKAKPVPPRMHLEAVRKMCVAMDVSPLDFYAYMLCMDAEEMADGFNAEVPPSERDGDAATAQSMLEATLDDDTQTDDLGGSLYQRAVEIAQEYKL